MKTWLFTAALLGGISVMLGAFAAHGLAGHVAPRLQAAFETAAQYQMVHALAIGLSALVMRGAARPRARRAALLFAAGIALFCGSLYVLVLTGIRNIGIVTPIGGVAFMAGWVMLALAALKLEEPS